MITANELAATFARNVSICQRQCEGLSHADSLLQPEHRGNCLNWVLGHIVAYRTTILRALKEQPAVSEAQWSRYGYGSEPVLDDGDDLLRLEELLAMLESSQATFDKRLSDLSAEELDESVEWLWGEESTLGQFLFYLCWHEAFHTGQTEYLRQLTGINDKVI